MTRIGIAAGLDSFVMWACAPAPSPTPTPSATPTIGADTYALPADPNLIQGPNATPIACAGVGLDATLTGRAGDPRKIWLEAAPSGATIELVWPIGFMVRFSGPDGFDVLDPASKVVAVGGSHVDGACVTGGSAYWLDSVLQ